VVPADTVLQFLHPLPVTVLWGVGAATAAPLHRLGVRTVGDLASIPADTLRRAVGAGAATHLAELAAGRDPRPVSPREIEKSISADHTTSTDLTAQAEVQRELLRLSGEVAHRLRGRRLVARTVGIKIRFADFRTVTRVRTLPTWTDSLDAVYEAALLLYAGLALDRPRIRLVGVKAEGLREVSEAPEQLALVGVGSSRSAADRVVDDIRARFGNQALDRGTLVQTGHDTDRGFQHVSGHAAGQLSRRESGSYAR
jgi:DNA polymerase-4